MISAAAPPPIPGTPIDPPPGDVPGFAKKLDSTQVGGIAYRSLLRYSHANVGLLAAGTAYFMFLALFSLLAFAYGVIAIIGAEDLADTLNEALNDALPGLVGEEGIDPDQLRSTGRTAGILGLVVLLYSSLGAVGGASSSMHLILGAPPDPRPFPRAKARHLLILAVVAPLLVVSFASLSLASTFAGPLLDAVGFDAGWQRAFLGGIGLLAGFLVDILILWILIGHLGGIRPHRRPRLIAAVMGAVAIGLVKQLMGIIVAWALDRPQYGAFAAPLAALFVLVLLAQVLYVCAAIAGGISDQDVPLDELAPTEEDAVAETPESGEPPEEAPGQGRGGPEASGREAEHGS